LPLSLSNISGPCTILGLDPGLQHTGWGIIQTHGSALHYIACGVVSVPAKQPLAQRLQALHDGLSDVCKTYNIDEAAVEETFVNNNPTATLKLGMARGVVLLVPALFGLPVAEYGANKVKKTVVGAGHADKNQVQHMVKMLLPKADFSGLKADATDALAVAICHAHHRPHLLLKEQIA
jgi:crossover junction endodeoxyribonuclease RuvC